MNIRRTRNFAWLLPAAVLGACASYVPPTAVPSEALARNLPAPFDRTWAAALRVAGPAVIESKTDKAHGLLTLEFGFKDPADDVDCGTTTRFGETTPALHGLGFSQAWLQGTVTVAVQSIDPGTTRLHYSGQYDLTGYQVDPYGVQQKIAEFRFTNDSADTQKVGTTSMTCRSSQALERKFLDDVAARL